MTDTANGFESCGITFGGGAPLFLLAGPCVIESAQHPLKMAKAIHAITSRLGIPYVFKASYDKANRSSVGNFRGPGAQEGLGILRAVKEETGLPIVTDIHSEAEIEDAAQVADILQIPAFLCRQTSLLVAAGQSGKIINIKKGQFMAPWDMKNAVDKTLSSGNGKILLTERGATFGYNNLVSDMRSLAMMRQYAPVVFDATHSAQLPGGQGGCSGGDREMAIVLARSAAAAGIDGIFMEVHDDPQNALCDGPNMIPLGKLEKLLETLLNIKQAAGV